MDDFPIEIDDFLSITIDSYLLLSIFFLFCDFDFYRFPISIDIIGGLGRLISMISIDFRDRFLLINYVWFIRNAWIWSITIITNGSLFPIRHFSKASLRSKATWVWQWNWEKFNLRLESPSCRKQTSTQQKNQIQKHCYKRNKQRSIWCAR